MQHKFNWTMPVLASSTDENGQLVGLPVKNWQTPPLPPKTVMQGKHCRIEPFNLDDHHEDLFHAFKLDTQASNWTYLPYGPFSELADFKAWCENTCLGDDPLFHVVIDNKTNKAAGLASYLRITPDNGSIEVGHIHFSPLIQRTRVSTESMYLMMSRVFDELGYRRYEWKCNALNTPSCKAAERFGFQFEGIFRQATIVKNQNRDTAWFAIIDSDWAALKTGFQTWLADENFDNDERQIRPLSDCLQLD